MVNVLSELRKEVKDLLNDAGLRAYDYMENKAVPPFAVVIPDDPYLMPSDTFGGKLNIRFKVFVAGPKGLSNKQAQDTEDMIIKAILALREEYDITDVTSPLPRELIQLNDVTVFGSEITIEATINLEEGEN
ncbi:hypothetical protein [Rhodococcus wratislaviensis]|uniref:hypothetical protein n=1 Tax=Rhodococcus wratislaviensis TaxID=44752 RepID=UPI0011BE5527|nr:hypothetical protein [Rhodococcus wratislaviensis]